jgi:hypothetical protein
MAKRKKITLVEELRAVRIYDFRGQGVESLLERAARRIEQLEGDIEHLESVIDLREENEQPLKKETVTPDDPMLYWCDREFCSQRGLVTRCAVCPRCATNTRPIAISVCMENTNITWEHPVDAMPVASVTLKKKKRKA